MWWWGQSWLKQKEWLARCLIDTEHHECSLCHYSFLYRRGKEAERGKAGCSRTQSRDLGPALNSKRVLSPLWLRELYSSLKIYSSVFSWWNWDTQALQSTCPLFHVPGHLAASENTDRQRSSCITLATVDGVFVLQWVLALGCMLALCSLATVKWVQFFQIHVSTLTQAAVSIFGQHLLVSQDSV